MPRKYIYMAAAAIAAFLAYKWWQKRQAAAAGAPATELKPGANAAAAGA